MSNAKITSIFIRCAMMLLMTLTSLPLCASFPRSDYLSRQVAKVTERDVRSLPVVKPYDGAASSHLCASAPLREKLYHRHFVWGPDIAGQQSASLESGAEGVGGLLLIREWKLGRGMKQYLPLTDGLGSVCGLIDATDGSLVAEYDYDPYGGPVIERGIAVNICPFRHRTRYYDSESWLYYYGYRYYDPSTTKWISKDPLGEAGGWNLTCFCDNDPVNGFDPLGLIGYDLSSPYAAGQYAAAERRAETYDPFAETKVFTEFGREILSDPAERDGFLLGMKVNSLAYCGSLTGPMAFSANLRWYSRMLLSSASEGAQWFVSDNGVDRLSGKTPDYAANSVEALQVAGTSLVLRGLFFGAGKAIDYAKQRLTILRAQKPVAPATQPIVNLKQSSAGAGGAVTKTTALVKYDAGFAVRQGAPVYRLWGEGTIEAGGSWTTVDPRLFRTIEEFKQAAGIGAWVRPPYKIATGQFRTLEGVTSRPALPVPQAPNPWLPELRVSPPQSVENAVININSKAW